MNERIWNQRMLGLTFNVEDGRITIFRSTLEALGWPTHYRFLYNREAKQVNATVGRCEGCVAKSAKGSQSGQNPGCLQGSKVEGDRVGRRQCGQVYSTSE